LSSEFSSHVGGSLENAFATGVVVADNSNNSIAISRPTIIL
jgi:hypothetical protein